MDFATVLDKLTKTKHVRKFYYRIPWQNVIDVSMGDEKFDPDECYFNIRLSEMFLKNKRFYWQGFIPMTIACIDFLHENISRSVPVYIGNNLLKSIEAPIQDQYIEYMNTNIFGPSPYFGGDISLFVGLFRTKVTDYSVLLFNFLEKIIKVFDITQLSSYLQISDALGSGLSELLGMDQHVQLQMGRRNVFSDRDGDLNRFRPGYHVYINSAEDTKIKPSNLWIKNGLLYYGEKPSELHPFQSHDYCLIELVRLEKRNDYTAMEFHNTYKKAQQEVFKGNATEADRLYLTMIQQIASSPDLTRPHRFHLIQVYSCNYEKQVELYRKATGKIMSSEVATRGPREGLRARDVFKKAARLSADRRLSPHAERALLDIGNHIEEVVGTITPEASLSNSDVNAQLTKIYHFNQVKQKDPGTLISALSADMLNP